MKRFLQSFKDAFNGIRYAFKHEKNFRVQCIVAIIVLFLIAIFPLRNVERLFIVIMVFMVLVIEMLNTAIERFIDLLKPRLHYYAKVIKDVMAGAVFLTTVSSVIIGLIIFIPYFINFVNSVI